MHWCKSDRSWEKNKVFLFFCKWIYLYTYVFDCICIYLYAIFVPLQISACICMYLVVFVCKCIYLQVYLLHGLKSSKDERCVYVCIVCIVCILMYMYVFIMISMTWAVTWRVNIYACICIYMHVYACIMIPIFRDLWCSWQSDSLSLWRLGFQVWSLQSTPSRSGHGCSGSEVLGWWINQLGCPGSPLFYLKPYPLHQVLGHDLAGCLQGLLRNEK